MDIDEEAALYQRHNGVDLSVPKEVFILGCGGTGSWTAIISAMIGVKSIHLSDEDIVEIHNLSRLPFPLDSVGQPKTEVLKEFIKTIRPDCEVITHEGIHNPSDLCIIMGDVLFDCNDDHNIQKMVSKYCKEYNMSYISVGCNSNHITIKSDISKLWGEGGQDRYVVTPMFIAPAMLAAIVAVWNVVKRKKQVDVLKSINEMFTNPVVGIPVECRECPLVESCEPCEEHGSAGQYVICTCCPIEIISI